MALIFLVTAFSILAGSIFQVFKSTSANLTVALRWRTTLAVDTKVSGVVMTTSPGPIFKMSNASSVAAVQDDSAKAYLAWAYLANNFSNSFVFGPVPHQPERRVSRTSRISSRNSRGLPKTKKSFLTGVAPSIAGLSIIVFCFLLIVSCFLVFAAHSHKTADGQPVEGKFCTFPRE